MSGNEEAALLALDKKIKDQKMAIEKRKQQELSAKLKQAEKRVLTAKEVEDVKTVFKKFDKDNSDTISLQELQSVAKELGCTMSDEEAKTAMTELDKNKDGSLNFEEFVSWWSSDAARGGTRGMALELVKMKMRAKILQEDLRSAMKKTAMTPPELGTTYGEFNSHIRMGTKKGDADKSSKVSVSIVPCNRAMVVKALEGKATMRKDAEEGEVKPGGFVTVKMPLRDGADETAAKELCDVLNETLSSVGNAVEGAYAKITFEDKSFVFTTGAYIDAEQDPVAPLLSAAFNIDGDAAEAYVAKAFESISFSAALATDLRDHFGYEKESNILAMFDGAEVRESVRLNRELVTMLDLANYDAAISTTYSAKDQARMCIFAHMLQKVDIEVAARPVEECAKDLIARLCSAPVKVARSLLRLNPECGVKLDDVAAEAAKLQECAMEIYGSTVGRICLGDLVLLLMRSTRAFPPKKILSLIAPLAKLTAGPSYIESLTCYSSMTVELTNAPVFDFVKEWDELAELQKKITQREMESSKTMKTKFEGVHESMAATKAMSVNDGFAAEFMKGMGQTATAMTVKPPKDGDGEEAQAVTN
eukprot:PhM_4_TR15801/c0_g2_i1/m.31859